jgi:hypothetical protein
MFSIKWYDSCIAVDYEGGECGKVRYRMLSPNICVRVWNCNEEKYAQSGTFLYDDFKIKKQPYTRKEMAMLNGMLEATYFDSRGRGTFINDDFVVIALKYTLGMECRFQVSTDVFEQFRFVLEEKGE